MEDEHVVTRIGIFGGSFDPIHYGHLIIAERFREAMQLQEVRFVPAKVSPFKTDQQPTSDKQRLEMLRLAIGAHPQFRIDDCELRRGGISYSIDTLREMQSADGQAEWFLLIGADSLRDFGRWKAPAEILGRAALVVARRGGEPEPEWSILSSLIEPSGVESIRARALDLPAIEISSSDIRARVRKGQSIRYLLPPAVESYIREQQLWQLLGEAPAAIADTRV